MCHVAQTPAARGGIVVAMTMLRIWISAPRGHRVDCPHAAVIAAVIHLARNLYNFLSDPADMLMSTTVSCLALAVGRLGRSQPARPAPH